jgi:molybdopterin-synthase adenylyltransferase
MSKNLEKLITIAGVGALGSNLCDTIARQGFTNIRVIDKDRVEKRNIRSQLYGEPDVGAVKVDALSTRIFRDVAVEIEAINKELTAGNSPKLFKGSALVVDCFDNTAARKLVQDECRAKQIPCLHAGMIEGYGEVVWDQKYMVPQDVKEGDVCERDLARNLIQMVVAMTAEEIQNFFLADKPRYANWSITLKDLALRRN